ncbi:MAG TPA: hypothetical protein VEH86_03395 [Candidatus Acidoferrum sp.]|nr:hypothetical protein [Candidatus Acidoferrum sp.]
MDQLKLSQDDSRFLQNVFKTDYAPASIRLRVGEQQYGLAEAIASFMFELHFPDVKDLIKRLYGEQKVNDLSFVRKIQTVLKKMEKSGIVKIMPKSKPWELQRYALSSFKFLDSDKNPVSFATEKQIEQTQNLLRSQSNRREQPRMNYIKLSILVLAVCASYASILWSLLQSVIIPAIFVPSLSISVLCSLVLGKILSKG